MKKTFVILCLFMASSFATMAGTTYLTDPGLIELRVCHDDPWNDGKKSPIQVPLVYQDGRELTFGTPINSTLQLLDAGGEVVFETTVTSATTSVLLPALVGTYELRLVFDNYYFYADITL